MMFRVIEHFKGALPPIDSRSPRDIESDIDDEIAFHLEMKTRDLVSSGVEPAAARGVAHQQFGDIQTIKTTCKRIALKERIMLQRVNFVMMIVVVGLVLALSYQIWTTQRKTANALGMITTEIAHFRNSDERAMSAASQPSGLIYVDGIIARPGTYNLPQLGALSLKRLIASAGGLTQKNTKARVTVTQLNKAGESIVKFTTDQLFDDPQTDYILSPNDHVIVERLATVQSEGDEFKTPHVGMYRQVDAEGKPIADEWRLEVIGPEDLRYRRISRGVQSPPIGLLSRGELQYYVLFHHDRALALHDRDDRRNQAECRWTFQGNRVLLSVVDAIKDAPDPIIFEPVAATG